MWYKNVGTSFFRFVTNHAFDRQTDGRTTVLSYLDRVKKWRRGVPIPVLVFSVYWYCNTWSNLTSDQLVFFLCSSKRVR